MSNLDSVGPIADGSPTEPPNHIHQLHAFLDAIIQMAEEIGGSLNLASVDPVRPGLRGKWFTDVMDAAAWATDENLQRAVYYCIGYGPDATGSHKARKDHITHAFGIVVDIDDAAAISRLEQSVYDFSLPPYSAYVMTGSKPHRRVQIVWLFEQPVTDLKCWADISRRACAALGGDKACAGDPSHLFRLPGLATHPKPEKMARGYANQRTAMKGNLASRVTLDDFAHLPAVAVSRMSTTCGRADPSIVVGDFSGLDPEAIVARLDPAMIGRLNTRANSEGKRHPHLASCICSLIRKGLTPEEVCAVIAHYPTGVGDKWLTDWHGDPAILRNYVARRAEFLSDEDAKFDAIGIVDFCDNDSP